MNEMSMFTSIPGSYNDATAFGKIILRLCCIPELCNMYSGHMTNARGKQVSVFKTEVFVVKLALSPSMIALFLLDLII